MRLFWLIALVLFTPIVGMVLNYDVFSWRNILIILIWTAMLLAPYVLTRKRPLYIAAASLLFVDGFINLFHWIILKCPLNASSIFVFMNTNWDEASEFMTMKITPLLLLLIPYVALFVLSIKNIPRLAFKSKGEIAVWSLVWIFATVFLVENIVHERFVRLAVPDVERAFASFVTESKEFRNLKNRDLLKVETCLTTKDSTLVVVIIGESCNRNHMSLYGYGRETTPRLQARNDLLTYNNVVSANSNTLRSVMNFLTENNAEHQRPLDSCLHIFDVLHSSPYKSYWISNQSPIGLWDNGVTSLAQNADVVTYVNLTANSSMESTLTASYDERLFAPLCTSIADSAKHKVVLLHLMGCHTNYSKRYPARFERFELSGDKRTRTINAYDNAVLYNDYIIDSIFSLLCRYSAAHPSVRVSALYFSDHGENVFDEGDYSGHDYSGSIPHANVEIPFLLWLSPNQNCPQQTADTPYMIDDLFHTILDIANLRTPCYDSTRSFINPHFDPTRQRILEDGNIYP